MNIVMSMNKGYLISMVPANDFESRKGKRNLFELFKESCSKIYNDDNERVYESFLFYDYLDGELRWEDNDGTPIEGENDNYPIIPPMFYDRIVEYLKGKGEKFFFVQVEELLDCRLEYDIPTNKYNFKLENVNLCINEMLSSFKEKPKVLSGLGADICTNFILYKEDNQDSEPQYTQCDCVDIEYGVSNKRWLSVCDCNLRPQGYDSILDDNPIISMYTPRIG